MDAAAGPPAGLATAQLDLRERARRFVDEVLIPREEPAERSGGDLPAGDVAEVKREAIAARLTAARTPRSTAARHGAR